MRPADAVWLMISLAFPALAAAAGPMKPGLWEMTVKSDMARQMPTLSPRQMEQLRRLGIQMPTVRDGAIVQKICVTEEMARREYPPLNREQSGCQVKNQSRSGNSYAVEVACDGANLKGTGMMKGSFSSAESYTTTYDFNGTAQGRAVHQHMEGSGKWLGAYCGEIKPLGELAGGAKR